MALQRYGGVGQGLMGATAPAVSRSPTPVTPGTANSALSPTSGVDERLDRQGPRGLTPEQGHAAELRRRKQQEQPLMGIGGGAPQQDSGMKILPYGGSKTGSTPALEAAISQGSPTLDALRTQYQGRFNPLATKQAQAQEHSVAPGQPSFGDDPSGRVNQRNPDMNPDLPFVQRGTTGGYQDGVGITIGSGRSITPELAAQQKLQALQQGVPMSFIDGFLRGNPGDTNRLIEGYNSERPNSRGGSWQDYALPSIEEAQKYFGIENKDLPNYYE